MIRLTLAMQPEPEYIEANANENVALPIAEEAGSTFLGWVQYAVQGYTFLHFSADTDCTLYPRFTTGPAYIVKSHFRGVRGDARSSRCQFRRYVVEIFLANTAASCGALKLENLHPGLYYFGDLPIDGITAKVDAVTNQRGGAYHGAAYFTTSAITVHWQSETPVDAVSEPQKVAVLLLCFGRWGMGYSEIERRTPDEILMAAPDYPAAADRKPAAVSANFYAGMVLEEEPGTLPRDMPGVRTGKCAAEAGDTDPGVPLARFALLADTHVGARYNWHGYDWLYRIFDHLQAIHAEEPLDFVLQLGDNIDDGYAASYAADYREYLQVIGKLAICDPVHPLEGRAEGKIPHYEIQGNHDTSPDTRFFRQKLWYAGREGHKVAFLSFFTKYGGYPAVRDLGESYKSYGILTDETIAWIADAVREAKNAGAVHIILCSHFGIAQDLEAPILPETGLGKLESICVQNGIQLFLNGHEHNPAYPLRLYHGIYDYDAAMTHDKYAVLEIFETHIRATIYRTDDNSVDRVDRIDLTV